MKRKGNDPVLEELDSVRRRLWRELSALPQARQQERIVQMAREVQEEAGVKLKVAPARPRRIRRMRKSG